MAVILAVCHLLGGLLARLGQPRVVGEILGGLLLGPSLLGAWWPAGSAWLFRSEVVTVVQSAAELGLVVFMFLLGSELQPGNLRRHRRAVAWVVTGAVGLPLLAGAGLAWVGLDLIADPVQPAPAQVAFFAIAMSITALPVLARILTDLRLAETPVGTLAVACAAVGDGVAWAALAGLLAVAGVGGSGDLVLTAALTAALLLATVTVVRPVLAAVVRAADARPSGSLPLLPLLVAGVLGFAATTDLIGLHPALGGLLFGLAVPGGSAAVARVHGQLRSFVVMVLLPLFFAGVGLHTTIGSVGGSPAAWLLLVAVVAVAVLAKLAGTGAGARLAGLPTREALRLGALMTCYGVTGLVVAAVGFRYQLVNSRGLTMLVLMALVTTLLTGPLVRLFAPRPAAGTGPDQPRSSTASALRSRSP
ncbi:MAG: cation/H(+) antiporter [Micromonosporaceae bacterium]|nr:cation/H(+) antiporter [Micromonosporaceae bacterium]